MWRFLAESVIGTSHFRTEVPCQDSSHVSQFITHGTNYLVIACSDGAGSASHSDLGSRIICESAVGQVSSYLDGGATLAHVDRATAIGWIDRIRETLTAAAEQNEVEVRQMAGTLLLGIVGAGMAIYLQIGDGAIVTLSDQFNGYPELVFWPQNGEYANTTYFVTDESVAEVAMFERREVEPSAAAVFTDGIQMLALDYASKIAHAPFFMPFFGQLTAAPDASDLKVPFRQFLCSELISKRTDDDKTLIVAVKVPGSANQ